MVARIFFEFVFHSKSSFYWPLKSSFPQSFHPSPVLISLFSQFHDKEHDFLSFRKWVSGSTRPCFVANLEKNEDQNVQNNPDDHQSRYIQLGGCQVSVIPIWCEQTTFSFMFVAIFERPL